MAEGPSRYDLVPGVGIHGPCLIQVWPGLTGQVGIGVGVGAGGKGMEQVEPFLVHEPQISMADVGAAVATAIGVGVGVAVGANEVLIARAITIRSGGKVG